MKTNSPKLYTLGLCLLAAFIGSTIICTLALSNNSFSDSWLTLCGVLIIGATLTGYHFFDGRRPVATTDRVQYSALCSAVSGVSGWILFVIISRAWNTTELAVTRNANSISRSGLGMAVGGALVGFVVCYYGFRHINED
jgi:hypothetical protein